jgi:hypothetical protein
MKVSLVTRAFVTRLLFLARTTALVLGCLAAMDFGQHRVPGRASFGVAVTLLVGGMIAVG